jgi:hypothetical protein
MGAGVATVGRRPYAVGLYWENSPSGRVSQAAKEAARQPGQQADFFAVRAGNKQGRVPQFGLSPASVGHKMSMPVFAACLANQQPGSWAGAFRLREGTVVAVVRDDLIVPDGDQLYMDEAEARDRLLQEIGFGGLQRIYAPEAWAIPGADTMPLSLLLNDKTDVRLRPVTIPKAMLIAGGAAVVLLVVVLGIGWYIQAEKAREEEAERERLAAIERAKRAIGLPLEGQQPQYPPPVRVWESDPFPASFIAACHTALGQAPAAVAGWSLTSLTCSGTSLSLTWKRSGGFSAPPSQFSIDETGTSASFNVTLPPVTERGHQDLVDPVEVTHRYLAQNWPGTIGHAPDDPPPPPPPGYTGEWNPPKPPWIKRSFTVTMPVLPWTMLTLFGDLPGTVVNSLKYAPNGSWTVEGVIYENRR